MKGGVIVRNDQGSAAGSLRVESLAEQVALTA
jgi:hypothetical protein